MDQYFKRKDQCNGAQNTNAVGNINVELQKARTQSPVPSVRVSTPVQTNDIKVSTKKIVYAHDLEQIKNSISELKANTEKSLNDHKNSLNDALSQHKETLNKVLDDHKKSVDGKLESTKVESLKQSVNESVKMFNDNVKSIAGKLVETHDRISVLESKMSEFESIM
jgi:ABC-type transporter Mla subunit MlaD